MFQTILCVCTGNLCRSPMAAALLRERLGAETTVISAGTGAPVGEPAASHAVAVTAERGIDLALHRAQRATPELLQTADVVLAADAGHVRELLRLAPWMRGRVFRLGHWRDMDIPDPIGGAQADFERCYGMIEECVADWMPRLQPESVQRDA